MGRFEATLTSKGQITVPSRLRSELGLKPGDKIVFRRDDSGAIQVEAKTTTLADLFGIVREGPKGITGTDVTRWIGESRGARWPTRRG